MEHLRLIEEDLRNLGAECSRKYPEVEEATSRALDSLKAVREAYVNILRKEAASSLSPQIPENPDLASPYILVCNYADCSHKLIMTALSGLQALLNYNVVPVSEIQNILRVLVIQISCGRSENNLKLIQILLSLTTLLTKNTQEFYTCADQTVSALLSALILLCDVKQPKTVLTAALGTTRQVVALLIEKTILSIYEITPHERAKVDLRFFMLIQETCNLLRTSANFSRQSNFVTCNLAMDILIEMITNRSTFLKDNFYKTDVSKIINMCFAAFFKELQGEYMHAYNRVGVSSTNNLVSKCLNLLCLLVDNQLISQDALDHLSSFLIDALYPARDIAKELDPKTIYKPLKGSEAYQDADSSSRQKFDENSSLIISSAASALLSKFSTVLSSSSSSSSIYKGQLSTERAGFLVVFFKRNVERSDFKVSAQNDLEDKGVIPIFLTFSCMDLLIRLLVKQSAINNQANIHLMQSFVINCCFLINFCLRSGCEVRDLERDMKDSLCRKILQTHWSDAQFKPFVPYSTGAISIWETIHEFCLLNSAINVTVNDLFILSVLGIEICVKILFKMSMTQHALSPASQPYLFISPSLQGTYSANRGAFCDKIGLVTFLETVYEPILDCYAVLLRQSDCSVLHRSLVQTLSEVCLCCSALSLTKANQIVLSFMCKHSMPLWHGQELLTERSSRSQSYQNEQDARKNERKYGASTLKWKHLHMLTKLLQVLHVTANCVIDWDCIIDCIEQVHSLASKAQGQWTENSSPVQRSIRSSDLSSYIAAFVRFSDYTVYLSKDRLIRLMSSLVALSINNIAIFSTGVMGEVRSFLSEQANTTVKTMGLEENLQDLLYSVRSVVDVTKANFFRAAVIWQMVSSHLRMIIGSKAKAKRDFAMEAIFDIISSVLRYEDENHGDNSFDDMTLLNEDASDFNERSTKDIDQIIFLPLSDACMPPLDSVFISREFHRSYLSGVLMEVKGDPRLSQADLLSCLISLSTVRFDDVRLPFLRTLGTFLRKMGSFLKGGEAGGWKVFLDILGSVPLSHTSSVFRAEWNSSNLASLSGTDLLLDSAETDEQSTWPKEALTDAFNSLAVVIEDFLEPMMNDETFVKTLLNVLSLFGSQSSDTNISLSAVEVLWKVADSAISSKKRSNAMVFNIDMQSDCLATDSLIEVMFRRLYQLSLDSRPEVRHCSINTLFTTMANNASHISTAMWTFAFEKITSPLFQICGARSKLAMRINEQAVAPELKKGIKMTVHHSRDTAHKQWSETRVLIIKGLLRVLKSTLGHCDNQSLWICIEDVSNNVLLDTQIEGEVFHASEELLFCGLKTLYEIVDNKISATKAFSSENVLRLWTRLEYIAEVCSKIHHLRSEFTSKILDLYSALRKRGSFTQGNGLEDFLKVLVALCQPIEENKKQAIDYSSQVKPLLVTILQDVDKIMPQHFSTWLSSLTYLAFADCFGSNEEMDEGENGTVSDLACGILMELIEKISNQEQLASAKVVAFTFFELFGMRKLEALVTSLAKNLTNAFANLQLLFSTSQMSVLHAFVEANGDGLSKRSRGFAMFKYLPIRFVQNKLICLLSLVLDTLLVYINDQDSKPSFSSWNSINLNSSTIQLTLLVIFTMLDINKNTGGGDCLLTCFHYLRLIFKPELSSFRGETPLLKVLDMLSFSVLTTIEENMKEKESRYLLELLDYCLKLFQSEIDNLGTPKTIQQRMKAHAFLITAALMNISAQNIEICNVACKCAAWLRFIKSLPGDLDPFGLSLCKFILQHKKGSSLQSQLFTEVFVVFLTFDETEKLMPMSPPNNQSTSHSASNLFLLYDEILDLLQSSASAEVRFAAVEVLRHMDIRQVIISLEHQQSYLNSELESSKREVLQIDIDRYKYR